MSSYEFILKVRRSRLLELRGFIYKISKWVICKIRNQFFAGEMPRYRSQGFSLRFELGIRLTVLRNGHLVCKRYDRLVHGYGCCSLGIKVEISWVVIDNERVNERNEWIFTSTTTLVSWAGARKVIKRKETFLLPLLMRILWGYEIHTGTYSFADDHAL